MSIPGGGGAIASASNLSVPELVPVSMSGIRSMFGSVSVHVSAQVPVSSVSSSGVSASVSVSGSGSDSMSRVVSVPVSSVSASGASASVVSVSASVKCKRQHVSPFCSAETRWQTRSVPSPACGGRARARGRGASRNCA